MMGSLPDFVGIGAQRSGTGWLARCLDEHPEIAFSDPPEIHFFDSNWKKGVEWYEDQLPGGEERIVGEKTPEYMYEPEAVERMAKVVPEAKLIAILRNPVDRAYSAYWTLRDRLEGDSFEQAIEQHPELLDRGMYARQLRHVFDHFPRDHVKVMIYDDLVHDDTGFLEEVYGFLDVDPSFRPSFLGKTYNAVVFPRIQRTLEALRLDWSIDVAKAVGLDAPVRWLHRRFRTGGYPPMDEQMRERLTAEFREPNEELEHLLSVELPWS